MIKDLYNIIKQKQRPIEWTILVVLLVITFKILALYLVDHKYEILSRIEGALSRDSARTTIYIFAMVVVLSLYTFLKLSADSEFFRTIKGKTEIVDDLSAKVRRLHLEVEKIKVLKGELTSDSVNKLAEILQKEAVANVSAKAIVEMERKFSKYIEKNADLSLVNNGLNALKLRLMKEIERLSRNAGINLLIGVVTTLAAAAILLTVALTVHPQDLVNWQGSVISILPRVSLAIFVEVFSFFFLKLYRNSLQEIKYYHNELTNIDMKALALNITILFPEKADVEILCRELMATERNFVLAKGDTTVYLEKEKVEAEKAANTIKAVESIVNSLKNKG